jgi:prepilin peptidase CpaA
MNLMALAPDWLIMLLCLTLAVAAAEDAIRLRISNGLVIAIAVGAVIAIFALGPTFALWQNLALSIGVLIVGTGLFSAKILGGGDVKLLAAVALWVDLAHVLLFLAAVFIAGGLLAAAMLSSRLLVGRGNGVALRDRARRVPYAVAIAAGAFFLLAVQQDLLFARHSNPLLVHSLGKESGPAR